ncbi:MAG: hypothetical protein J3R72DRAFT_459040 [Linnemannia gamsii]|nr:MAG: hypothetical protein J3R72DRAFT_459040 [Linnemannia gamsii]
MTDKPETDAITQSFLRRRLTFFLLLCLLHPTHSLTTTSPTKGEQMVFDEQRNGSYKEDMMGWREKERETRRKVHASTV